MDPTRRALWRYRADLCGDSAGVHVLGSPGALSAVAVGVVAPLE
jgi:hypothetical protein